MDAHVKAGHMLRILIEENYHSQEEFADDFGADLRTINRYINEGIKRIDTVQQLADFFQIDFVDFFTSTP